MIQAKLKDPEHDDHDQDHDDDPRNDNRSERQSCERHPVSFRGYLPAISYPLAREPHMREREQRAASTESTQSYRFGREAGARESGVRRPSPLRLRRRDRLARSERLLREAGKPCSCMIQPPAQEPALPARPPRSTPA